MSSILPRRSFLSIGAWGPSHLLGVLASVHDIVGVDVVVAAGFFRLLHWFGEKSGRESNELVPPERGSSAGFGHGLRLVSAWPNGTDQTISKVAHAIRNIAPCSHYLHAGRGLFPPSGQENCRVPAGGAVCAGTMALASGYSGNRLPQRPAIRLVSLAETAS
jgi:hypothetical protein